MVRENEKTRRKGKELGVEKHERSGRFVLAYRNRFLQCYRAKNAIEEGEKFGSYFLLAILG